MALYCILCSSLGRFTSFINTVLRHCYWKLFYLHEFFALLRLSLVYFSLYIILWYQFLFTRRVLSVILVAIRINLSSFLNIVQHTTYILFLILSNLSIQYFSNSFLFFTLNSPWWSVLNSLFNYVVQYLELLFVLLHPQHLVKS